MSGSDHGNAHPSSCGLLTPCGVFGLLGLCINVHNTDINNAVSLASPKSLDQDVATVFRALVLKEEVLDGWALLLLRG
jgi:hypothetical protein